MSEKNCFIIALLALALLLFNGCVLPIEQAEESRSIEFHKDGSFKISGIVAGTTATGAEEWQSDCSTKMREGVDESIKLMQTKLAETSNSTGLSEEEKTAKIRNISKQINILTAAKNGMQCTLTITGETSTYSYSIEMAYNEFEILYSATETEEEPLIKKNDDSTYSISLKSNPIAPPELRPPLTTLKSIELKFEGTVQEITPEASEVQENTYKYNDISGLSSQAITARFLPEGATLGTGTTGNGADGTGSQAAGFDLSGLLPPLITDNLLYIGLGILLVIVGIVAFKKIKKVKGSMDDKKFEKEKEETEGKKAPKKPEDEKKEQVKKLAEILKEKVGEYTEEEIKKAVLNQGYSKDIAAQVLKELFP